jgi:hypothetical protein
MALRQKVPVARESVSDREFEVLLRRAFACRVVRRLQLVKTNRVTRKPPRPAA